jgi:hypothetical protein
LIRVSNISKRFDEVAILASLGHVAFSPLSELLEGDYAVIAALRRSSDDWDLSIEETSERLASFDEDQLGGLINNVKGILHEMEFQRLEDDDGDTVFAALYPDTNHKSVDVQLTDNATGDSWDVQLKATDNSSVIKDWMEMNPDTEILVTEELAESMDISSSGFSNEELTMRVEDFVDRMIERNEHGDPSLWDHFPLLVAASSGIIVFELWRRYRRGELMFDEFRGLTVRTLGIKTGKYIALMAALSVPGLNVIVGAYLLGSLILAAADVVQNAPSFKPFKARSAI